MNKYIYIYNKGVRVTVDTPKNQTNRAKPPKKTMQHHV